MMSEYRAAYWISADEQAEVVLTRPEDAHLSDEDLVLKAYEEMAQVSMQMDGGRIVINTWTE